MRPSSFLASARGGHVELAARMAEALVIFKPDASYRLAARAALWGWLKSQSDWKIEGLRWFQPTTPLIESHYDFLAGKPFFPWLVDFMTALPLVVGRISASGETLERMRYDLGETRIAQSRPGSLRERFGIFGGVNCMHLSDSPESGAAEVAKWSPHVQLTGIDVDLDQPVTTPDHTYRLRSLAAQISGGIHVGLASSEFKQLLREETYLDDSKFESLTRITLEAFS
jgi:nucleoside-diphosphate kinase